MPVQQVSVVLLWSMVHILLMVNGPQWRSCKALLRAVGKVLESFAPKLHEWLRWFTDNQNVVRILMTGSKKAFLHAKALRYFQLVCIII